MKSKQVPLTEAGIGQLCKVVAIATDCGLCRRLESLGIRPGKVIKKVCSVFKKGPVVVDVDGFQLAIGYCKALKIIVEVDDSENGFANGKPQCR